MDISNIYTVSPKTHYLAVTDENTPMNHGGEPVFVHIATKIMISMPLTPKIAADFGLRRVPPIPSPHRIATEALDLSNIATTTQQICDSSSDGLFKDKYQPKSRFNWCDNATLYLIALCDHLYDRFVMEKKHQVWGDIALAMNAKGFAVHKYQCRAKFNYLRRKYIEQIDCMRKDALNGAAITSPYFCPYFAQMHEVFTKNRNIYSPPNSVASSDVVTSAGNSPSASNEEQLEEYKNEENTQPTKRRKTSTLETALTQIYARLHQLEKLKETSGSK